MFQVPSGQLRTALYDLLCDLLGQCIQGLVSLHSMDHKPRAHHVWIPADWGTLAFQRGLRSEDRKRSMGGRRAVGDGNGDFDVRCFTRTEKRDGQHMSAIVQGVEDA